MGDVVSGVNGQHIGTEVDWLAQRMNFEADNPVAIRVERAGQPIDLKITVHGRTWDDLDHAAKTSQIIFLANKFITLVIGLFVVFSRPKDLVSRIGGWVSVAMATVYEPFPIGLSLRTCIAICRGDRSDAGTCERRDSHAAPGRIFLLISKNSFY